MKVDKLAEAYRLIQDFKRGSFEVGAPISKKQTELLKTLAADLGYNATAEKYDIDSWIPDLASLESRWNHEAMNTVDDVYKLMDKGQVQDAKNLAKNFLEKCPSSWYKNIVKSVL